MSTMEKLVERVARAICLAHGQTPDETAPTAMICGPNNEPLPNWTYYEEDARAAIAALKQEAAPDVVGLLREARKCFNDKGLHISAVQGGHPDQQTLIARIDAALESGRE